MMKLLFILERAVWGFWDVVRRLVGLVLPFFAQAREFRGWGRGLRWTVHVLLLAAILVGLYFLNAWLELSKINVGPTWLRPYWLDVVFLLIYALAWLAWWLWKLLGPEEEVAEFPDIDAAWDEALRALYQAGIDLTEAPLFLVLGRPVGGEDALFNAAQLQLSVKGVPVRPDAPLRVFANRDGIYVTCAGASLLGRQAAILAGQDDGSVDGMVVAPIAGVEMGGGSDDPFKTLPPTGRLGDVQKVLARAQAQGRGPQQLTEYEKREIRALLNEDRIEAKEKQGKPRRPLLKNTSEANLFAARLAYLCRLIVRDRRPYCPINGILVLVPLSATDTDEDASQTGSICQQDLATARRVLQVHCPVFTLLCDLERVPGFREFIDRFPVEQKARRLGQRFPLVPDLAEDESAVDLADRGGQWICTSLLPTWVYKLFRVEMPGQEEVWTVAGGNAKLFQLLTQMRDRRHRLGRLLARGLAVERGASLLFGGCYLAGTGGDVLHEQAFVAGVFRRLLEEQNYVSWTDEALRQEANCDLWTKIGYGAVGIGVIGLAVGIWLLNRG